MKHLLIMIFVVSIMAVPAYSAIVPGTYKGDIHYTTGAKKKTYNKKRSVSIYVQLTSQEADSAIGLIVDETTSSAALYRLEELPDGNQLWIQMYQGSNNTLKVNEEATPDFRGVTVGNKLSLRPAESRTRCTEGSIDATLSNHARWSPMPNESLAFKQSKTEVAYYTPGRGEASFRGQVNLGQQSISGTVHLTEALPNIYVVRRTVEDQKSISGYKVERRLVGFVTNIVSRGNSLLFVGLPEGSRLCSYNAKLLRQE